MNQSDQNDNTMQDVNNLDPYSKPVLVRQHRYNNTSNTSVLSVDPSVLSVEDIFSTTSIMRSISNLEKPSVNN